MTRETLIAARSIAEDLLEHLTRLDTLCLYGVQDTEHWGEEFEAEARSQLKELASLLAPVKQVEAAE